MGFLSGLTNIFSSVGDTVAGLFGQGSNDRGAKRSMDSQNAIYGDMASQFSKYFPGYSNAQATLSGMRPDGTFDPNFDPYSQSKGSIIGNYGDMAAGNYDHAVNAAGNDLLSRGIQGQSALLPAQVDQIRRQQATDQAGFTRNLGVQADQERYNRIAQGISNMMQAGQGAGAGYGAVGTQYANKSAQGASNLTNLAGAVAQF